MGALLVVLFLVVPVVEIYVIVQVGQEIGALPTIALLIVESLIGAWLVRREGRRAWEALRTALTTGRLPGGELADAALVLVGGTLLLTPGFVSDIARLPADPAAHPAAGAQGARPVPRAPDRGDGRRPDGVGPARVATPGRRPSGPSGPRAVAQPQLQRPGGDGRGRRRPGRPGRPGATAPPADGLIGWRHRAGAERARTHDVRAHRRGGGADPDGSC